MKRLSMEFLGTFFFVLAVALTNNPIAIGCMLMAVVYIGGYISGAHYNPLLSFAINRIGRLNSRDLLLYWGAQLLGGCAAFALAAFLKGAIAIPAPGTGVSLVQAFFVEILLSFIFALLVLTVAMTDKFKNSHIFGFAIGFAIPALVAVGGPISGGVFNPAIALGANLVGLAKGMAVQWSHVGMYVIGALVGGFLAAHAFSYFQEK